MDCAVFRESTDFSRILVSSIYAPDFVPVDDAQQHPAHHGDSVSGGHYGVTGYQPGAVF